MCKYTRNSTTKQQRIKQKAFLKQKCSLTQLSQNTAQPPNINATMMAENTTVKFNNQIKSRPKWMPSECTTQCNPNSNAHVSWNQSECASADKCKFKYMKSQAYADATGMDKIKQCCVGWSQMQSGGYATWWSSVESQVKAAEVQENSQNQTCQN